MDLETTESFSTDAESNCIFLSWDGEEYSNKYSPTGKCRNFIALDSDGVECSFSTVMVIGHPDYMNRKANK